MSKSNYDVIIIGGGHNGLVCANILAKKNKKVLICEARERCGGLINNEITNFIPPISPIVSNALGRLSIKYNPKIAEGRTPRKVIGKNQLPVNAIVPRLNPLYPNNTLFENILISVADKQIVDKK